MMTKTQMASAPAVAGKGKKSFVASVLNKSRFAVKKRPSKKLTKRSAAAKILIGGMVKK